MTSRPQGAPGRSAEERAALAAMFAVSILVAQLVAGKATRDALFLSSFNVRWLPPVLMATAALAVASVLGFSRLMSRRSPSRVVRGAVAASAALLLAEWGLSFKAPQLTSLAVYGHLAVFGGAVVSGCWSLVNERFDPYAARRAVRRITTGSTVGALLGAVLAWGWSRLFAVESMLPLMAGGHLLALYALVVLGRGGRAEAIPEPDALEAASGLHVLRETPYLRSLALVVGLSALTEALLEFVLNAEAKRSFTSGSELMSFFSLYYLALGVFGLLVQMAFARWTLASFGPARSVGVKPAAVALGGALAALWPSLFAAAVARGGVAIAHHSVYRSGYELLFTPLPARQKRSVKALIDVGVDKLGAFAGAAVAAAAVALLSEAAPRLLGALAALLGLALLAICRGLHLGYMGTLKDKLRSGTDRLGSIDVSDATTRDAPDLLLSGVWGAAPEAEPWQADIGGDPLLARISALRSPVASVARRELRGAELEPVLVAHGIELLARDELARDAVVALRAAAAGATGQLVDALLDATRPRAIRRRVPRVLKGCATSRAAEGLRLGLADEIFEVRYECGIALARIAESRPELAPPAPRVYDAVLAELERERCDGLLEHVINLLSMVVEREPLRLCYLALRSAHSVRGTALEYLENVLPERVRTALWPLLEADETGSAGSERRSRTELVEELSRSWHRRSGSQSSEDENEK